MFADRKKHLVRVQNPSRRNVGGALEALGRLAAVPTGKKAKKKITTSVRSKHNLVRVHNPKALRLLNQAVSQAGGRAEAERLFREFRGRDPKSTRLMEARRGTPKDVAELGGLVELVLNSETVQKRTIRALGVPMTTDKHGNRILKFDPMRVKLVADGHGDMHIVGLYYSLPEGMRAERGYFLGDVLCVTYRADKPHIENGVLEYEHTFAERSGKRPQLFYKAGYLCFREGTYSITKLGIDG